jgi:hypothetical protein
LKDSILILPSMQFHLEYVNPPSMTSTTNCNNPNILG